MENELLVRSASPKKVMPLLFVIDKSGSMAGERIASVNKSMADILPMLNEISADNNDAKIKIGIMEFDHNPNWITPSLIEPNAYDWIDIRTDGGLTNFGLACKSLNEKLSKNALLSDPEGYNKPVIIILSDGEPTDEWKHEIEKLKQNQWFKQSQKFAIAIGHDAVIKENLEALYNFTGHIEGILLAKDVESLKKMVQIVSVTSSLINSKSKADQSTSGMTDEQLDEQAMKDTYKVVNDTVVADVDGAVTSTNDSFGDLDFSKFT